MNTLKKSCKTEFKLASVKDDTIWRWKDAVIARTSETLQRLGFFGSAGSESSSRPALP